MTRDPRQILGDIVSPQGRLDPFSLYDELRAHGPVVPIRPGLVATVGYEACQQSLRSQALSVLDEVGLSSTIPEWRRHPAIVAYLSSMLHSNRPAHGQVRRRAAPVFAPAMVAGLEDQVVRLTDDLLDDLASAGPTGTRDFVSAFASRLPIAVIGAVLGVPVPDQQWLTRCAASLTLALEGISNPDRLAEADRAMSELGDYLEWEVCQRPGSAQTDVVAALLGADQTGAVLDRDTVLGNLMLILTAGFETTSFFFAWAVRHAAGGLSFGGDHRERLATDPDFTADFVEEVLRLESPVQATSRWAGAPVEIDGVSVPEGTKVLVILGAGNRDPLKFPDPHRFDPSRPDVKPLTFGAGPHYCLGAPLSRLEARVALPRLFARFPWLHDTGPSRRRDQWVGRGYESLEVRPGPESVDLSLAEAG